MKIYTSAKYYFSRTSAGIHVFLLCLKCGTKYGGPDIGSITVYTDWKPTDLRTHKMYMANGIPAVILTERLQLIYYKALHLKFLD